MNHSEAAIAINERLTATMPDDLYVEYENAPMAKPGDESPLVQKPNDRLWTRASILWGESNQASLGANKFFRTFGILVVQIFSPLEQGDGDALTLAEIIKQAFRSVKADGITWRTPSLATVGRDEQWWQTNVSCPFYFDELE